MNGTVTALSGEGLQAKRAELLTRVPMPWERIVELADAYALDADERNVYATIRVIDYLLAGMRPDR